MYEALRLALKIPSVAESLAFARVEYLTLSQWEIPSTSGILLGTWTHSGMASCLLCKPHQSSPCSVMPSVVDSLACFGVESPARSSLPRCSANPIGPVSCFNHSHTDRPWLAVNIPPIVDSFRTYVPGILQVIAVDPLARSASACSQNLIGYRLFGSFRCGVLEPLA